MTNVRLTRRGAYQIGKLHAMQGIDKSPSKGLTLHVLEGYNAGYKEGKDIGKH